jgi:hypothetical protein
VKKQELAQLDTPGNEKPESANAPPDHHRKGKKTY